MAADATPRSDRHPPPGSEDPTPSRGPGRQRLLTHEAVALAAFDLVDAEGPAALTMSRLGKRLGVSAMTLYGYAESKDAIVSMLAEFLLADLPPVPRETPWTEAVETTFLTSTAGSSSTATLLQVITHGGVFVREQADADRRATGVSGGVRAQHERRFYPSANRSNVHGRLCDLRDRGARHSRIAASRTNWTKTLDPVEFPASRRRLGAIRGGGRRDAVPARAAPDSRQSRTIGARALRR